MDIAIVIVAAVLLLSAGGAGAYLYRAVVRPLPAIGLNGDDRPDLATGEPPTVASGRANGDPAAPRIVALDNGEARREWDRLREDARAISTEMDNALSRLRERRDAVLSEAEALAARVRDELAKAETARRIGESTLAELAHARDAIQSYRVDGDDGMSVVLAGVRAERAETVAELYRRLAKVETALATLTAPILLPGERFVVPEEFPPEALRWENWKEVGESAYSLGDYFHGRRLLLETTTADAMGDCLTCMRIALTEQIYPNLKSLPSPEDADALRTGLERIATEVGLVRTRLEVDYRELATNQAADDPRRPPA